MLDRLIRAFLVVGGVSVGCAWTWPGAFPEADPVAVLVRYHTPNVYRAVVAWYYLAPGVAVFLAGQFLISTSRIWFARMGVSLGLRSRLPTWPLSPTADGPAIVVGEVHHPVRAIESPAPEWLTIPERGLYTGVAIFGAVGSGKTSACMHPFARQLLSWHADESRAARRRARPGSEGRFLPRHPPDADRAGPQRRLHRAVPRWPADVEPAECHLARCVLARLHGRVPLESTVRQGQRTLLAAGLHESGPLDHRAVPGAARRMGDAARRVPLRHRQGAVRQEDRTGADLRGGPRRHVDQHRGNRDEPRADHPLESLRVSAAPGRRDPLSRARTPSRDHVPHRPHDHASDRTHREHDDDGDPAPGRSRQPLVCPRLEHPRQQDPVEHRGGGVGVPQHVRCAVRRAGLLPARARGAAVPRHGRTAADRPGWPRTARAPRHRLERRSSAPRSPHRGRQGAGLEYARRHQPRARPGDRRDAQKCVAPIAPAPAGNDAGRARSLRPTGRLYLRRISSVRQRRRGRPERRRESLCAHPAMPRHPHRRHAIHQLTPIRARQFRGVADAPANAPHQDLSELERRGQRRDRLEAVRAGRQD